MKEAQWRFRFFHTCSGNPDQPPEFPGKELSGMKLSFHSHPVMKRDRWERMALPKPEKGWQFQEEKKNSCRFLPWHQNQDWPMQTESPYRLKQILQIYLDYSCRTKLQGCL